MALLNLPDHTPTSRVYTPGTIPETKFEGQNGATTYIRFGNVPVKSTLKLVYQNISESVAHEFTDFYIECIVTDAKIRIPNKTTKDVKDQEFRLLMAGREDGLIWRFEKPPNIQTTLANRYNVNIDLIGVLLA